MVKVQQSAPPPVATLVKTQSGPTSQPAPGGQTLTFPLHLAKSNSKGSAPGTPTTGSPKQVQTLTSVQQLMLQRRQQDQVAPVAQQVPSPHHPVTPSSRPHGPQGLTTEQATKIAMQVMY